MNRSSAHALLEVLAANGVDRIFEVPGESYLGVLDALIDFPQIDTVVCRHEGGAGFMAVADARLSGRPGVVAVSRGPGASNAAIAVHTAQQDAVPLILLVGQIPQRDLRREAFQEIDYQKMYGSIAKWVFECTAPEQLAEAAFKAVRVATTGTAGPVVLVLPEDVQQQPVPSPAWRASPPTSTLPDPATLAALRDRLAAAERPLIIAGGQFERPGGREALAAFARQNGIPVVVSFRRQDLFPSSDALYVGDLGLANPAAQLDAMRESDLILALGTRLGDIPTQGYTFPDAPPRLRQTLVHCHPDPRVIGQHYDADFGLAGDPVALLRALTGNDAGTPQAPMPAARTAWAARLRNIHDGIAEWPERNPSDGIDFARVVRSLDEQATDDVIICLDAGTFAAPVYRHFRFDAPRLLMSPLAGAMGYGTPAAVASALRCPGRRVVCMMGDGGFMMTGNEMILAVQRRLPVTFILSNNACYASIRINQEREYPGRVHGTALFNPDFTAMARAFGMPARHVNEVSDIDSAVSEALAIDGPAFIEVDTSLQAVLPQQRGE